MLPAAGPRGSPVARSAPVPFGVRFGGGLALAPQTFFGRFVFSGFLAALGLSALFAPCPGAPGRAWVNGGEVGAVGSCLATVPRSASRARRALKRPEEGEGLARPPPLCSPFSAWGGAVGPRGGVFPVGPLCLTRHHPQAPPRSRGPAQGCGAFLCRTPPRFYVLLNEDPGRVNRLAPS